MRVFSPGNSCSTTDGIFWIPDNKINHRGRHSRMFLAADKRRLRSRLTWTPSYHRRTSLISPHPASVEPSKLPPLEVELLCRINIRFSSWRRKHLQPCHGRRKNDFNTLTYVDLIESIILHNGSASLIILSLIYQ